MDDIQLTVINKLNKFVLTGNTNKLKHINKIYKLSQNYKDIILSFKPWCYCVNNSGNVKLDILNWFTKEFKLTIDELLYYNNKNDSLIVKVIEKDDVEVLNWIYKKYKSEIINVLHDPQMYNKLYQKVLLESSNNIQKWLNQIC